MDWGMVGTEAVAGATLGATAGSFFPGPGTVIGAGVGAVTGAVVGIVGSESADKAKKRLYRRTPKFTINKNAPDKIIGSSTGAFDASGIGSEYGIDKNVEKKLNDIDSTLRTINTIAGAASSVGGTLKASGVSFGKKDVSTPETNNPTITFNKPKPPALNPMGGPVTNITNVGDNLYGANELYNSLYGSSFKPEPDKISKSSIFELGTQGITNWEMRKGGKNTGTSQEIEAEGGEIDVEFDEDYNVVKTTPILGASHERGGVDRVLPPNHAILNKGQQARLNAGEPLYNIVKSLPDVNDDNSPAVTGKINPPYTAEDSVYYNLKPNVKPVIAEDDLLQYIKSVDINDPLQQIRFGAKPDQSYDNVRRADIDNSYPGQQVWAYPKQFKDIKSSEKKSSTTEKTNVQREQEAFDTRQAWYLKRSQYIRKGKEEYARRYPDDLSFGDNRKNIEAMKKGDNLIRAKIEIDNDIKWDFGGDKNKYYDHLRKQYNIPKFKVGPSTYTPKDGTKPTVEPDNIADQTIADATSGGSSSSIGGEINLFSKPQFKGLAGRFFDANPTTSPSGKSTPVTPKTDPADEKKKDVVIHKNWMQNLSDNMGPEEWTLLANQVGNLLSMTQRDPKRDIIPGTTVDEPLKYSPTRISATPYLENLNKSYNSLINFYKQSGKNTAGLTSWLRESNAKIQESVDARNSEADQNAIALNTKASADRSQLQAQLDSRRTEMQLSSDKDWHTIIGQKEVARATAVSAGLNAIGQYEQAKDDAVFSDMIRDKLKAINFGG